MLRENTNPELSFIEALKSGDNQAYAKLYDAYAHVLHGLILRIVKHEGDAENLLQDCFVKIWQKIEYYNPSKGRLSTWLINIARNTAIDFTRSGYASLRKKSLDLDNYTFSENILVSNPQTDTIDLPMILEKLTPQYRETIEKMYFGGYSQQEISDTFHIPLGTVKSRTRLALKELRNLYF
jgi:RNA polymerase sigma-70 factor (ECF subfamily)